MTRPVRRGPSLAREFAADPATAVLRVLATGREQSARGMTPAEVKAVLCEAGVAKSDADAAWRRVQRRVATHEHVQVESKRYRWIEPVLPASTVTAPTVTAPTVSAVDALASLLKGRLSQARRAELAEVVRAALTAPPPPARRANRTKPATAAVPEAELAARQRQAAIDSVRDLAELAGEVEELVTNAVEPEVLIRQVRARVRKRGLEPIDRAGAELPFDRRRHEPIGPPIRDGVPVVVVRPGYVWKAPTEDVLIGKAIVEE